MSPLGFRIQDLFNRAVGKAQYKTVLKSGLILTARWQEGKRHLTLSRISEAGPSRQEAETCVAHFPFAQPYEIEAAEVDGRPAFVIVEK